MPLETLTAVTECSADDGSMQKSTPAAPDFFLREALNRARRVLSGCRWGGDETALRSELRAVATELGKRSGKFRSEIVFAELNSLRQEVGRAGGYDYIPAAEDLALAQACLDKGWSGLLGATLLVPAWSLPEAPELDAVPTWFWRDYSSWVFFTPSRGGGQPAEFTVHWLRRLETLARWVQRSSGAAAVQEALDVYLGEPVDADLFADATSRCRQAELRGQMLAHSLVPRRMAVESLPIPRSGRRLKVAFVARNFGPGPDLYTSLPCFQFLDSTSFEVVLLALEDAVSPETQTAVGCVKQYLVLPADQDERLALLRHSGLDVIVYVGDLAGPVDGLTRLAMHRVAPLQVVNNRAGLTSGLPSIDLYVSGAQPATHTAAAGFTERLGLLRGPAHTYAFARDGAANLVIPTREQLGVAVDAVVLATVATHAGVSGALLAVWADVLAICPSAQLLVGFIGAGTRNGLDRFCSRIDAALTLRGVNASRVTIFPSEGGAAPDVRSLVSAADLYLDPAGIATSHWLAEALCAHRPVVALRRSGNPDLAAIADLLQQADMADLIADDHAAYGRLAIDLVGDAGRRTAYATRAQAALAKGPGFLDALAASDAFGALLETAYDELASLGGAEFRSQRDPLCCFGVDDVKETVAAGLEAYETGDIDTALYNSNVALRTAPADYRVRYLRGLVLHRQRELSRAIDYLVAAVQDSRVEPGVWFSLASVLRDHRQIAQAIEVLEVCIRLDPSQVEPLLMLLDLADGAGATEIATEVRQCLQKVAPDDPRVMSIC